MGITHFNCNHFLTRNVKHFEDVAGGTEAQLTQFFEVGHFTFIALQRKSCIYFTAYEQIYYATMAIATTAVLLSSFNKCEPDEPLHPEALAIIIANTDHMTRKTNRLATLPLTVLVSWNHLFMSLGLRL